MPLIVDDVVEVFTVTVALLQMVILSYPSVHVIVG
jgi:hypothetical protein